ncbi:hypothetical protein [Streptomyces sp. NBC_01497]|uniref:hypothetical protein n=1 Tax=Streptomyces sp. NBC_01497 TaxID=2903885 RepID=UPI002E2F7C1C|nr:hypothetical protein [Streptomyces sp. NBC_01497]
MSAKAMSAKAAVDDRLIEQLVSRAQSEPLTISDTTDRPPRWMRLCVVGLAV